jgi:hypothetical protein
MKQALGSGLLENLCGEKIGTNCSVFIVDKLSLFKT